MDQESENLMDSELLTASRSGDLEKIKTLGEKNEKNIYEATTPEGNTIIHMAARFGHLQLVEHILEQHPIMEQHPSIVLKSNFKRETPVHLAARAGKVHVVKFFIDSMKSFTEIYISRIRDEYGNTPLHGAAKNNEEDVVKALADNDRASLCLRNDEGESPLSIAIYMRFTALARTIIDLEPSTLDFTNQHNGQTPLHYAVTRGDYDIMICILQKKKDLIKSQDDKKRTPLHCAAALGYCPMAQVLLWQDPKTLYVRDNNQQTPLHWAVKKSPRFLIDDMLKSCPDTIEMVDKARCNILHLAAENGNFSVVLHILKLEEMEYLVNSPDINGDTPLHLAAKNYHSDVVKALSHHERVEIRAINKLRKTALDVVKMSGDRGMEEQKHLTLKALKSAYKQKDIDPDIDLEKDLESMQLDDAITEKAGNDGKKSREMAQIITVISTLIATFTFTAAFTLPGGFKNDGSDAGMAVLIKKPAFQAFIITDTVAMTSSITSAIIVSWSTSRRNNELLMDTLPVALGLTWISLMSMALAFVTGLFVVLEKTLWLALLVCVIGCALPLLLLLHVLTPIFGPYLLIVELLKLVVAGLVQMMFRSFRSWCQSSCSCSSELPSCFKCCSTRNH